MAAVYALRAEQAGRGRQKTFNVILCPAPELPRRSIDPQKAAELAAILEKKQKAKRSRKVAADENQLTLFDFVA